MKTVKSIPRSEFTNEANYISSHTLYKVNQNDDGSLKLKSRIAPHGNEDDLKEVLNNDCSTCPRMVYGFWNLSHHSMR